MIPKVTYYDKENFNIQDQFTGFGSKSKVNIIKILTNRKTLVFKKFYKTNR